MIRTCSEKYKSSSANEYEIKQGIHFPDTIIDSVKALYQRETRSMSSGTLKAAYIPIKEAKIMIADALTEFNQEMGLHAKQILNDETRMNIRLVASDDVSNMYCLPAGVTRSHLRQRGMFDENSDTGAEVINDQPYATIHLDYDGTINTVVYLAHELGHAMADDKQQVAGNDFADNPAHMEEVQAYVIQHVVRKHLEGSVSDDIAHDAKNQYAEEFQQYIEDYMRVTQDDDIRLHGRAPAFTLAASIAENLTNNPSLRGYGMDVLMGMYGPATITQSLASIGIERAETLQSTLANVLPKSTAIAAPEWKPQEGTSLNT